MAHSAGNDDSESRIVVECYFAELRTFGYCDVVSDRRRNGWLLAGLLGIAYEFFDRYDSRGVNWFDKFFWQPGRIRWPFYCWQVEYNDGFVFWRRAVSFSLGTDCVILNTLATANKEGTSE